MGVRIQAGLVLERGVGGGNWRCDLCVWCVFVAAAFSSHSNTHRSSRRTASTTTLASLGLKEATSSRTSVA